MFARIATSRLFFGRHFLHPDKIPAPHFPFSDYRLKMRLLPKCANADTPPVSFNAILRHPCAKIIASRLHYSLFHVEIDKF